MRSLLYFIAIILCCNCFAQESLSDNRTFRRVFSKTELKDVETIFDFFNSNVCNEPDNNNLDTCYRRFLHKTVRKISEGNVDFGISYEKQRELYNRIDSSTFFKLWDFNKYWETEAKMDTMRSMTYKYDGKFIKLIKKLGRKNKAVKYYYKNFLEAGDISPSATASILMNYKYYNIKDNRVKFLIAMHCLTLNDKKFRKEKY